MSRAATWGAYRVLDVWYSAPYRSFTAPVPAGAATATHTFALVEPVDAYGNAIGAIDTVAFQGADTDGGLTTSTMPVLRTGRAYVLLLAASPLGWTPMLDRASVFEVHGTAGAVSPWDAVRFHRDHGFAPAGRGAVPVTDATLHEVLDELARVAASSRRGMP